VTAINPLAATTFSLDMPQYATTTRDVVESTAPVDLEPLIRRYLDGEDSAFDEIVAHTKHPAFALAYRWTRDREQAFDIVQEAYVKLYKFLSKWNYSCRLQTWLYRVVTNTCIDKHRRQHLQLVPLDEENGVGHAAAVADGNPRTALLRREQRELLESGISQLPPKMQAIVRLKYAGSLTIKEIAAIQESSIGTIKATLHQATRKLRTILGNL
jgi:RNA polymerase sigma-70 factor (ECF subfamily)